MIEAKDVARIGSWPKGVTDAREPLFLSVAETIGRMAFPEDYVRVAWFMLGLSANPRCFTVQRSILSSDMQDCLDEKCILCLDIHFLPGCLKDAIAAIILELKIGIHSIEAVFVIRYLESVFLGLSEEGKDYVWHKKLVRSKIPQILEAKGIPHKASTITEDLG